MDINLVFNILIIIWLTVITVILFKTVRHYSRLVGDSSSYTLKEILDNLIREKKAIRNETEALNSRVGEISRAIGYHINRIGIIRFNPFSDTGGSQSFTVALLDDLNNGLVMTSLFARTGNRWYVKEIIAGAGRELELTKEEKQAIEKAKKSVRSK